MHTIFFAVELVLKLLMKVVTLITKEKANYLNVPSDILSPVTVHRICRIGHLLPSHILSVIFGVKTLPNIWPYYASELNRNGAIVPLAIALAFIPIAILNGIIIEKILESTNPTYRSFKNSLIDTNEY